MVIYLAPNVSTWAPEIFFKIILNLVNNDNQFGFKSKASCFSGLLFRKFPIFRNCSNCLVRWWWSATSSIKLKKLVSSRYTQLEVWQTTKPWPISRDQSNWQTDSNRPGLVKSISRFYNGDSPRKIMFWTSDVHCSSSSKDRLRLERKDTSRERLVKRIRRKDTSQ